MSANVTVCLVTYNSARVLAGCLSSIPADCKVIVYDNGSHDDSIATVLRLRPAAEVIRGNTNLGFGAGHNRLLARVDTTFALILNPDTVLSPNAINQFVNVAELNPHAAIIGAAHRDGEGNPASSCKADYVYYSRWAALHQPLPENLPTIKRWPLIQGHTCVDMVSGAAMFMRMDLFKGIGFFDPNIFLYFEDDDICVRVRQAGYNILYDPNILITHLGGQSTRRSLRGTLFKQKHFAWSRLYIYCKYTGTYGMAPSVTKVIRRDKRKYTRQLLRGIFIMNWELAARSLGGLLGIMAYRKSPQRAPL